MWQDLDRAVDDAADTGRALSIARFSFEGVTDGRSLLDAARCSVGWCAISISRVGTRTALSLQPSPKPIPKRPCRGPPDCERSFARPSFRPVDRRSIRPTISARHVQAHGQREHAGRARRRLSPSSAGPFHGASRVKVGAACGAAAGITATQIGSSRFQQEWPPMTLPIDMISNILCPVVLHRQAPCKGTRVRPNIPVKVPLAVNSSIRGCLAKA